MKSLFITSLFLFSTCLFAYAAPDTEVVGAGGGGVTEGSDVGFGNMTATSLSVGAGKTLLFPTLDNATGHEVALTLEYTTNKATSGNDTGLVINQTDTASPGTSLLIDARIGTVSQWKATNNGITTQTGVMNTNAGIVSPNIRGAGTNNTLEVQNGRLFNVADNVLELLGDSTYMYHSTGHMNGVAILGLHTSIGDSSATDLLINRDQRSTGSGPQLLFDAQVNDVSKFRVDINGSSDTGGAVAFSGISTVTVDYAIGDFADDPTFFVECDATLGNISTTLPPVADKKGRLLGIKLMSAANGCYLDGNGAETIDGAAGQTITIRYNVINLIAGSSEWLIGW